MHIICILFDLFQIYLCNGFPTYGDVYLSFLFKFEQIRVKSLESDNITLKYLLFKLLNISSQHCWHDVKMIAEWALEQNMTSERIKWNAFLA